MVWCVFACVYLTHTNWDCVKPKYIGLGGKELYKWETNCIKEKDYSSPLIFTSVSPKMRVCLIVTIVYMQNTHQLVPCFYRLCSVFRRIKNSSILLFLEEMRATLFLIDSVSLPKYDINEFSVGVFGVRDTLLPTEKCVLVQEEMLTPPVLSLTIC